MKTLTSLALLFTVFTTMAEDLYFSQSGAGLHNGTVGNEWSVSEASTAGNWGAGAGKISAGDTLHVTGIITSSLTCQGGGTAGSPVILFFEPNAKFSSGAFPNSGAINCNGFSNITIDGGANGVIENTDNGSGLGHQQQSVGLSAQLVNSLEVRRLTVRNIYRHTSSADTTPLDAPDGAIYFGHQTNVFIHDCTFGDVHWAVNLNFAYGSTRDVTVSNCFIYNVDHGVVAGGFGSASYNLTNLYIFGNTFSNYANWDTTASVYHHDGIHVFGKAGAVAQNIVISGNTFMGEIGDHQCTGHIYCEADDQGGTGGSGGYKIYNNLFLPPGNHGNFGTISGGGIGVCNGWVANNTIYGANNNNHSTFRFSAGNWGFTNNIIVGAWSAISPYPISGGILNWHFDHNLYVSIGGGGWNGNSWAAWSASNDSNSTTNAVSGLASSGIPQSGSPVINAGVNLNNLFNTDMAGNTRGSLWDIGAFEYLGTAPPNTNPVIVITPTNLNFGSIVTGSTSNLSLTVQNTGAGTLTGGASATVPYRIVSGGTYNLLSGQSQTVTVAYTPTATGTNVQNITFTGAGGAIAAVTGSAFLQPTLSVTPSNLNFGAVGIGTTSNLSFTIQNTDGGTLSGGVSAPTPFGIVSGGTYNLLAGQTQTVTVVYQPTTAGTNVQTITFTGAGGAVAAVAGSAYPLPTIAITPTNLNFGTVVIGNTSNLSFTVQNTGGGTLTGTAGTTAPFSIIAGSTYNLLAGQTQAVMVAYNPASAGIHVQNISFTGGNGAVGSVNGRAVAPPIVSSINNLCIDVDTNLSGLQIIAGSMDQYSATATDPNGYPLVWQWTYAVNGGLETLVKSGTGTVSSVSYIYSTNTAGGKYVWKLLANNGYSTAQSTLTVGLEAPPPMVTGFVFQAAAASITPPFVLTNGIISQSVQTTDPAQGGRAAFNFTIVNAGNYVIQALMNAPGDANNSLFLNVDAEPTAPTMIWDIPITTGFEQRIASWRGTGSDTNNQYIPKLFTLTTGTHQLIFRGRESGVQLQSLIISNVLTAPPHLRVTSPKK